MSASEALALESLTRELFQPVIGTAFKVPRVDGTHYELVLTEVRDVFVGGNREGKWLAFALTFLGEKPRYLSQGTHTLLHDHLGRLDIFVVPLGPDLQKGGRMSYEAIFT